MHDPPLVTVKYTVEDALHKSANYFFGEIIILVYMVEQFLTHSLINMANEFFILVKIIKSDHTRVIDSLHNLHIDI